MSATSVITFDKENKQDDYQFMARSLKTNKLIVGWIVIEQPWYSHPREWKYYIYNNEYGSGFCGGASDLGLKRELVNPDTIEIYNQTSAIKLNQERGFNTKLVNKFDLFNEDENNVIAVIGIEDEIPYELWKSK